VLHISHKNLKQKKRSESKRNEFIWRQGCKKDCAQAVIFNLKNCTQKRHKSKELTLPAEAEKRGSPLHN